MNNYDETLKKPPKELRINYVQQLNIFRSLSGVMRLKPQAVALYDVLFSINNRKAFREWFLVTNDYLQENANIVSWPAFNNARQTLIDKGFIRYNPGNINAPGEYSIVKLHDPLPDRFKHDMEIANQRYTSMEEKIRIFLYQYNTKNAARVSTQAANREIEAPADCEIEAPTDCEIEVPADCEIEVPADCEIEVLADCEIEVPADCEIEVPADCEIEGKLTAKSKYINKINKLCIKNNNKNSTDNWFKPHIEIMGQEELEQDALNRAKHRRWFARHSRNGRLSKTEKDNFDILEATYSAEEIDRAIEKAEAHNATTAGYVLRILKNTRR